MRFSITLNFSQADRDWREAYAAHDVFAEAGDDDSPAAKKASKAEYEALDKVTKMPATTAMEARRKLEIICTDRMSEMSIEDVEDELQQIRRDLLTFYRPNASPAIAEAFDTWAAARTASCFAEGDDVDEALHAAECEAFMALLALPCTTPGDFIVKSYVDLIDNVGGVPEGDGQPLPYWPFEPNMKAPPAESGSHDAEALRARYRDIAECDLGRCMIALGKVDFDAGAWMRQAVRVGKTVGVMVDGERRCIWLGELGGSIQMRDMLQCLMAGGLDDISGERCDALADEIEANYPHMVSRRSEAVAAEAVEA